MINPKLVFSLREIRRESPTAISPMPTEASIRGSIRSESLPATGEKLACTAGMATKIKPALWGLNPFIYCK